MWFWFSLIALLCWSGSDLFSKIGCQDADDKYSQFKMVIAVGVVMGLHAAYEIFIGGTEISWDVIVTYLPVSLLYIVSMTLGYVGLRYIELSISSPICNSSGALVAVLTLITSGIGGLARRPAGGDGARLHRRHRSRHRRSARGRRAARRAPAGREPAATPSPPSRSFCRCCTAFSMRWGRLPTRACSRRSTRTAPTAPMS